jgi:serine/threonine protein kinase
VSIPSSVGRYRIDRVLGSGAFASVWLGHDDALDAQVAIKVLSGSLLDDLDVRNRFLEEARILRRADSERLVRVHDIGELPDGRPYFVMSYADQGSLADRMRKRPIPIGEALSLAEEIARGVEVINRLGVIHRDLKPSNILFQSAPDDGERLLIADLGLAKALAHASGAFTLPVGTPGYMSPEQARFGGGLDVRADVYGIGALTYHLITGHAPGPAPIRVPPSAALRGLPAQVDELIMKAMEIDRENRWPTAEAFAEAIAGLRMDMPTPVGGVPVVTSEPGQEQRPPDEEQQQQPPAPTRQPPPPDPRWQPPPERHGQPGPGQMPPPGPPPGTPGMPPPGPPPGTPGQQPSRPAQPPAGPGVPGHAPGPDDATAEIPLPPAAGSEATGVDEEPAGAEQAGGGTAVYPSMSSPQEARAEPPTSADVIREGAPPTPPAPSTWAAEGTARRLLIPAGIAAGILVLAVAGGLLFGNVFGGDGKTKGKQTQPPAGFSTVSESKGRLSVTVPTQWAKQQEETWLPSSVGLTRDAKQQPVLRATPNLAQFRALKQATPGVFVGMTRDLTPGRLPPPSVSQHPGCSQEKAKPYQRGTLKGTITRWVRCDNGPISFSEIGLTDTAGKFGLWIRIKQIDNNDLTTQILDSLKAKTA